MKESLLDKLQKFGLNLYEAKAYAGLLKTGTANAYKVSKESGIPRARIYDILESLVERGMAMVEESSENVKIYTPVPSKVFLDRKKREWESDFEEISTDLQELEAEVKQDIYVFTVKGKENILAYCKQLLKEADRYAVISMWDEMYELLLPELAECEKRNCRVLGISHDVKNPIGMIEKHREHKIHHMPDNAHWFILAIDGKKMLYGYSALADKDAFYTEDASHIYLMEDYVLHDMIINRFTENKENADNMALMMQEIVNNMERKQNV